MPYADLKVPLRTLLVSLFCGALLLLHPAQNSFAAAPQTVPQKTADDFDELDDDGFDEVEELEEVDIADVKSENRAAQGMIATLLGKVGFFHSALVHLPIAWLLLLVMVDGLGLLLGRESYQSIGKSLLALTVFSFAPAVASGLARVEATELEGESLEAALEHRNLLFGALALLIASTAMRFKGFSDHPGPKRHLYLICIVLALLLTGYGGHLGGKMVFGEMP